MQESETPHAVGGEFAVTATLPTYADVVAFKEATRGFENGYYRYVAHPYLRRIAEDLSARLGCRHCKLAESREVALLELLLSLSEGRALTRLHVATSEGADPVVQDVSFFPVARRGEIEIVPRIAELQRGDVFLLSVPRTEGIRPRLVEGIGRAGAAGASVVVLLAEPPQSPPELQGVRFWVTGLAGDARGGAVLGSGDKPMARLAERMKRRGAYLSPREAAPPRDYRASGEDPRGAYSRVCDALCRMEGGERAFLYPSGMEAVTRALDLLRAAGKSHLIAIGYLFNDTSESVRLPESAGAEENTFLGVDELDRLEQAITDHTAAILTETITNPLNDVPDIPRIAAIAHARGVPLIVDNTVATPLLCQPFALGADAVVHSTTKYLNGRNDHGGGALIVRSAEHARLLGEMRARWNDAMSPFEAAVLERGIGTLAARMERFNANARRVAAFLSGHAAVRRLYFNGDTSHRSYETARRLLRGPSSVISFTLARDSLDALRAFYDSPLPGLIKAPSLGSDLTLLCPYTLLTHYNDTDEQLAAIGLPRCLLRVSVGCEEDVQPVIDSLADALARVS